MRSPVPDYLLDVLDAVRSIDDGAPADYIEVLAKADTSRLAVALATVDGEVYAAGDSDVAFSIQSISKPFAYAAAIEDVGLDAVLARIGVEPSGNAFNELSLEDGTHRPMNPMINAGALATHALVAGPDASGPQRVERLRTLMSAMAGRELGYDEAVYEAELRDAHRNRGLAHMLRAGGIINAEAETIVDGYVRQCSVDVTVRDLALMAATLANGGVQPLTGRQVIHRDGVRQVLSVMTTCGMYDAAGDWVSNVGIPAKSGVAGGIIGALPGQLGLAVFSPKLDAHGNSARGVAVCERLSRDMGLHMMDVSQIGRAVVRKLVVTLAGGKGRTGDAIVPVYELRGAVLFGGAELLTRALAHDLGDANDAGAGHHREATAVILSLLHTHSLNDVATRMLLENLRRLHADRRTVVLVDPDGVLDLTSLDHAQRPRVVATDAEAQAVVGGDACRIVASQEDTDR
ncbi:glutaminase [Luteimonas sp. SJ-92]|uniref:Glutaminase n=1 Tax=Luteimonas salinisoli TaxID=2752307 RepID=A0A853JBB6_9GAMM|nr:glutaminase [Luteimonas salinisoli]NZA26536.1 glutaminase [Luteimonas salinisoli]